MVRLPLHSSPRALRSVVRIPLWTIAGILLIGQPGSSAPLRQVELVPLVAGNRVMLIYDSRENAREDHNPLSGVVAETLGRMGLAVRWWDWAKGPPDDLEEVRCVITGFRDGQMPDARGHVAFARRVLDMGIHLGIFGTFGAFQEETDGQFLPAHEVNEVFRRLGVRYDAWWTDDPSRFITRVEDPRLGPPDAVRSVDVRHFFQMTPLRPDVHVWVSGRRQEAGQPLSAPVFTSPSGGLVLARYLFPGDEPEALRPGISLRPLLEEMVALRPGDREAPLVIWDEMSPDSRRAVQGIGQAAAYLGLPLAGVDLRGLGSLRPFDLSGFRAVVLALPEVPSPLDGYLKGLFDSFLAGGGRVVSVLPIRNPSLSRVLGQQDGLVPAPVQVNRLRFGDSAFPGLDGFEVERPTEDGWNALAYRLHPGCRVWIRGWVAGGSNEVPLAWRCAAGKGEVSSLGVWEFADRAYLGVLAQTLLDGQGSFAMPVLASRVEFVDDCPLPMTGGLLPSMGKTDIRFYLDDFLPTLLRLAERHNLRPTALAVFGYDDRTRPPFDEPWAGPGREGSLEMGRRLVEKGVALGLHGVNHVSPALSGGVNRPFPDEEALREWFREGRRAFQELFGPENRPAVFVPPNDYLDRAAKRALVQAVPEVQVLSSVLAGSSVETSQDFTLDPEEPSLVSLPRTWAGMRLQGDAAMGLVNGLLLQVVSSHFVHPDDALDPERAGGLPWKDLRGAWERGMEELVSRFGYLRPMTALEVAEVIRRQAATGLRIERPEPGVLVVHRASGHPGTLTLLVRLVPGCHPRWTGGRPLFSHPISGRHLVVVDGPFLTAQCETRPPGTSSGSLPGRGT